MSVPSPVPDLPLEILSMITSLLNHPYYPPRRSLEDVSASSTPLDTPTEEAPGPPPPLSLSTSEILALDPHPPEQITPGQAISRISKSSHKLLEASRPWLWENVDLKSGRGWLAVVNALTEEIGATTGEEEVPSTHEGIKGKGREVPMDGTPGLEASPLALAPAIEGLPPLPSLPAAEGLPAPDAHTQPNTIPGGMARYISPTPSHTYPYPTAPGGSTVPPPPTWNPIYTYSPPQPPSVSMLLTPPGSRNASPHPIFTSPKAPTAARLRGRSRSPRRSIEFDTEGIQAVLDRSRSASAHVGLQRVVSGGSWPRRFPLERRTSLSRSRTRADYNLDDSSSDEEENIIVKDDKFDKRSNFSDDPIHEAHEGHEGAGLDEDVDAEEENWINVNPELLPEPGPYIRHLSFENFRTIGTRRTQDEAVRGRFVTAGRLEGVIKNAPNLLSLSMTEYVDSALSYDVLEELFFRGQKRPRAFRRTSNYTRSLSRVRSMSADPSTFPENAHHDQLDPARPTYVPYEDETEEDKWHRRSKFTAMEALDFTGCTSRMFTDGMEEFWERWYAPDEGVDEEDDRGRARGRARRRGDASATEPETEDEDPASRLRAASRRRTPIFPSLKRLSLRACWSLDANLLSAIMTSFPNLTHLDLSNTKISSPWLMELTRRPPRGMKLRSLSLARCARLDPFVIVDFIVRCPAAFDLEELNLFVNPTAGSPIRADDLMTLITTAPCFRSGRLRYLDLSSAKFTPEHLAVGVFPSQPNLVSLGLSHIPSLALPPIAEFLLRQAPNVEILGLTGTAFETSLRPTSSALQINLELHTRLINPCTTVPFSLSSLHLGGVPPPPAPGPTRLRVIELSSPIRRAIGPEGGSNEWKVIKSKGGRGWYVDCSAGWVQDIKPDAIEWRFARHLPAQHAWRRWLLGLSEASGRVSSSVGWHSRKMEVVRGWGMMGREEGLAGAGAFAFEE